MNQNTINQEKFFDILFDNSREIVEKSHHVSNCEFVTVLYEDGKVAAERVITEAGVTYKFFGEHQ